VEDSAPSFRLYPHYVPTGSLLSNSDIAQVLIMYHAPVIAQTT
jgi:hypothetical protein